VPLVLHGSSGVPLPTLAAAVAAGITKVNVGTALNTAYTAAVRAALAADGTVVDPRRYLAGARTAMAAAVAEVVTTLTGTRPVSRT
jgi:fructose-bisphosphate aldolase class II